MLRHVAVGIVLFFTCRKRPASSSRTGREMEGVLNRACASMSVLPPPRITVKNMLPSNGYTQIPSPQIMNDAGIG